ncbi:hypothetical protein BG015_001037 [Linnemannia schmuckeri]|uniref:BHLH domain-containing protein n=1 Tax=Linnemannia schmuckeri TaxID=64567 RepID=A0A9P5VE38_9FUNG|nr:hypothetical protein BG015_001037 [Linnemannia schmuckeri]
MTATTATPAAPPTKNVFRLHGVNVLNRKNVDSISRLTALEKRRATHILDERQRRDTMNQLLAELANLVRESAAEVAAAQQQQQEQHQQSQLNADGTEKKAPVKSNSITTLRNAITEIRRLRSCAGLETTTPPCAASLAVISPNASRSSSPVSQTSYTKKQQKQEQQQQVQLPALAPSSSQYSTPASSPKAYANQVPPMASYYHHHHQLQSPPLSPSSPDSHQYHPSSVSPPTMAVHSTPAPQLPSLFANYQSSSPYSYQSQSQQYNQQPQQQHSQYYSQYSTPSKYESYSRSASPSSSGYSSSTAPSMILPQPYMQQHSQQQYSAYAPM